MHGNVWQWVEDTIHPHYTVAPNDGSARTEDADTSRRGIRGGSFVSQREELGSAYRNYSSASLRFLPKDHARRTVIHSPLIIGPGRRRQLSRPQIW
jgi:hypothetical protein